MHVVPLIWSYAVAVVPLGMFLMEARLGKMPVMSQN